jgi:3-oxoadipate enol-lactonase
MSIATTALINGITMRYAVAGPTDAPAVVLHHPLATNLTYWDELTAALVPAYRVVRFDARGHGLTEAPMGRYNFDVLADDVTGLMDHVGVTRAAFIGLSMGGMVGQVLGWRHPDRFNSLMIVSSTSRVAPEFRGLWSDRVAVARAKGMGSQVAPAMARWVAEAVKAENPALIARFTEMIETTPLEGYAGWCSAIEHLDNTGKLSAIKLPVRVVVGAVDPATPVAASEIIHKAVAGSDLVIIPGVSHMLACENPAAFHATVLPFLAQHAGLSKPAGH